MFLWAGLPYLALGIFAVGHIWRWSYDQFGWTSRSTQLQEWRLLKWGSPLFHYGTFAAIGGHVIGVLIPQSRTRAIGIPENVYRWFSAGAGTLAAVLVIGGIVVLASRRLLVPWVRATTSPIDYVALILLLLVILTGIAPTIGGQPARPRLQLPDHRRALVPRPVRGQSRRDRHRARAAHLPTPRPRGVAHLGRVAVQPAGARLELPTVVTVAALHRLPLPPGCPARRARHRRAQMAQDRRALLT